MKCYRIIYLDYPQICADLCKYVQKCTEIFFYTQKYTELLFCPDLSFTHLREYIWSQGPYKLITMSLYSITLKNYNNIILDLFA
jgi:hypothetical protein